MSTFIRDGQQAATGTEDGDIIMWEPFMRVAKSAAKSPSGAPPQVPTHGVPSCRAFGISRPARAQTLEPFSCTTCCSFMPHHAIMTWHRDLHAQWHYSSRKRPPSTMSFPKRKAPANVLVNLANMQIKQAAMFLCGTDSSVCAQCRCCLVSFFAFVQP